jgi:hypothetical protein
MVRLVFIAVFLVGMVVSVPAGDAVFSAISVGEAKVFPNPFKTEITVDLTDFNSDVDITITDVLGKIILKKHVTNSKSAIINLENKNLRRGIYIVNLKSMEQSISKRIVKK